MSINGITFSGLASGLDTDAIIRGLLQLERRPIALLETRQANFKKQKSLLGDLEAKLGKLFDAAKKLRLSSSFLDFKTATDDENHLSATATSGATAGSYRIKVNQLAQARVAASAGEADRNATTHGSGLLVFTIDGKPNYVNITDSTLDGMAAAINGANIGVRAQVVDTGQGATPFKLVVTALETGLKKGFTVSVDSADQALTDFAAALEADQTVLAKNAEIELDGLTVSRGTNKFSDLIAGVTINLQGAHTGGNVTMLTISPDTEATAKKVSDFVDAYNEVLDFIVEQQKVSVADDKKDTEDGPSTKTNPLFGDTALNRIRSGLRSILGGTVDTGNDSYAMLAQIGVETARDGKLTLNRGKFEEALLDDEQAVRNLFTDKASGIARGIYDRIDELRDPIDGVLAARTKGIDRSVQDIGRQITQAEDRLTRYEDLLRQKYANLELTIGRLNAQLGSLLSLRS